MILNLAVQCSGFEMLRASSIHPTAEQFGGRGGGQYVGQECDLYHILAMAVFILETTKTSDTN